MVKIMQQETNIRKYYYYYENPIYVKRQCNYS